MVTSRMLVVVVGNVERARVEELVRRTLGRMPRGSYAWTPPGATGRSGRALLTRAMPLPTNYLLGYYAGPGGARTRTIRRCASRPRCFRGGSSRRSVRGATCRTRSTRRFSNAPSRTAACTSRRSIRRRRSCSCAARSIGCSESFIDRDGLERLVQQFITEYFLRNETNGDQATFLARAQIYQGDFRPASHFVDDLRRVQPEDVRRVAISYMHDFRFVYLGKLDALPRDLLAQF